MGPQPCLQGDGGRWELAPQLLHRMAGGAWGGGGGVQLREQQDFALLVLGLYAGVQVSFRVETLVSSIWP